MLSVPNSLLSLTFIPLFLSYTHLATALPINATSIPSITELLKGTRPSCATIQQFPDWYHASEKFDHGDCIKAIALFEKTYVIGREGRRYEFLTPGVIPVHTGTEPQYLPVRVAQGTCTIVIAMRSEFKEGQLPNATPGKTAGSDVSSFGTLNMGAHRIYEECSEHENQPGWYETGDLNSIGVFIFQSASKINQDLHSVRGILDTSSFLNSGFAYNGRNQNGRSPDGRPGMI